jgi:hypothetical protein
VRHAFSRRALLKAAGAAAALSPFVPVGVAGGQTATFPKRFVVVHTPNGLCQPGLFRVSPFGPILDPITATYGSRTLLLDGIDQKSVELDPNFAFNHPEAYTHNLTAATAVVKEGLQAYQMFFGGHPSVDQKIATFIRSPQGPFDSFHFAVQPQLNSSQSRISYREDLSPAPIVHEPQQAFNQLFAGAASSTVTRAEQRRSIIDRVLKPELTALRAQLPLAERHKVDAHLEAIRSIELRLGADVSRCQPPDLSAHAQEDDLPRVGKLHMDMLATALACDLTRVATLQWGYGTVQWTYPFAAINSAHHDLTHGKPTTATQDFRTQEAIRIGQWYATMVKYLLDKLASYPEGSGTVLDNTVVMWTSEHGSMPDDCNGHDAVRMPYILFGNVGGRLKTGRRAVYDHRSANDLFVSLCQLYGLSLTTFGNPACCTGPLPDFMS